MDNLSIAAIILSVLALVATFGVYTQVPDPANLVDQEDYSGLQKNIAGLQTDVFTLKAKDTTCQCKIDQRDLSDLEDNLADDIDNVEDDINDLQDDIKDLRNMIKDSVNQEDVEEIQDILDCMSGCGYLGCFRVCITPITVDL